MSKINGESELTFFEAASIIVGHGVGAGILSVPYLASHNSFRETVLILLLGYAAALFPVASVYAAWAVRGLADTLRRTGTTAGWSGQMMDFADFNRLVGLEGVRKLERGDLSGL